MNYNWDWQVFFALEPISSASYLEYFLIGIGWTLLVAVPAWIIAISLGIVVAGFNFAGNKLVGFLCGAYIEIFRSIPPLVQLFLWFFVVPEILPFSLGEHIKSIPIYLHTYISAVLAIGLLISSRMAEHIRSGINSLPSGQWLASRSLGMGTYQTYKLVILPQAFRVALPALTSESVNTVKNTSLAMMIGVMEIMGRARLMQETTYRVFEPLIVATVIYVMINISVILLMHLIEKRMHIPGFIVKNKH